MRATMLVVAAAILRVAEPGLVLRDLLRVVAQIGDAGRPEPGLRLGQRIHPAPQPQAFHRQRQLAQIAPDGAAPAPVAARLLAADRPLLAQRHGDSAPRQEQRRANADDAAADDDDIDALRQLRVGFDRIEDWSQGTLAAKSKSRDGISRARECQSHFPLPKLGRAGMGEASDDCLLPKRGFPLPNPPPCRGRGWQRSSQRRRP